VPVTSRFIWVAESSDLPADFIYTIVEGEGVKASTPMTGSDGIVEIPRRDGGRDSKH
jgi:hypothetical protein